MSLFLFCSPLFERWFLHNPHKITQDNFLRNPHGKPRNPSFFFKRKTPFPFRKRDSQINKNLSRKNTEGGLRTDWSEETFLGTFFSPLKKIIWIEKKVPLRLKSLVFFLTNFYRTTQNFWAFSVADCVVYAIQSPRIAKVIATQPIF